MTESQARRSRVVVQLPQLPLAQQLSQAARCLREGGLVAFPTETVYGLGANALLPEAIAAVFRAKGRPNDNPLILHVAEVGQIAALSRDFSPLARQLAERFMPGPLTLVLPAAEALRGHPALAGLDSVAVRIPAHDLAHELIRLADVPVAAPSANRSGRPSPTLARHVLEDLGHAIDWIVDGGATQYGLESTVLDLASGPQPRILRPGALSAEQLADFLEASSAPCTRLAGWRERLVAAPAADGAEAPRSPGLKYRHYAPRTPVWILDIEADEAAALWAQLEARGCRRLGWYLSEELAAKLEAGLPAELSQAAGLWPGWRLLYGPAQEHEAAAHGLFAALRQLDEEGLDAIVVAALPREGLGEAYMNRLERAAAARLSATGLEPIVHTERAAGEVRETRDDG